MGTGSAVVFGEVKPLVKPLTWLKLRVPNGVCGVSSLDLSAYVGL